MFDVLFIFLLSSNSLAANFEIYVVIGHHARIFTNPAASLKNESVSSVIPRGSLIFCAPDIISSGEYLEVIFPDYGYIALGNNPVDRVVKRFANGDLSDDKQVDYIGDGILRRFGEATEWTAQWPTGTGKTGALIGGNFADELVPVSIADFFVKKRVAKSNRRTVEAFQKSRRELLQGNLEAAHQSITGTEVAIDDAHLEYAADLTFCHSVKLFQPTKLTYSNVETQTPDRDLRTQPFDALSSLFPSCHENSKLNKNVKIVTFLDTHNGHVRSLILPQRDTLYRRDWFADIEHDVIVGYFDCMTKTGDRNCIHFAMRLSRQSGYHKPITVVSRPKVNVVNNRPDAKVQYLQMNILPSANAVCPHMVICVAVVCHHDKGESWQEQLLDTIICHNATGAEIVISVEKEDTLKATRNQPSVEQSKAIVLDLAERCWGKITRILTDPPTVTRSRHIKSFSDKMRRVGLSLLPKDQLVPSLIGDRLPRRRGHVPREGHFRSKEALAEASFHYGRYLMLSAASASVTNLQVSVYINTHVFN